MTSQDTKSGPGYGKLKNFFIDSDLDQRLSEVAAKENCSVSALIRRCCRESLDAREHNSDNSNN
jgi:predicted transcriptional regulator